MANPTDTSGSSPPEVPFTAWHAFLVELILFFTDLRRVDVRDFVKLGSLPLEADVILLLKQREAPAQGLMGPALAFLEPLLRDLTVIEYKSPTDVLDRVGVDTARTYGLLAKRKFLDRGIRRDGQVSIVLLYSHAQRGLFEELAADRLPFEPQAEGIRCHDGSMGIYAVNLVTLLQQQPHSVLNLVSARHHKYSQEPGLDPAALALVEQIRYLINRRAKVHGMSAEDLQGFQDIAQDADEIRRRFMQNSTVEERLAGLSPEDLLKRLSPEERLRGLGLEERLRGLGPEERLRGLGPEDLERLAALLRPRRS